MGLGFGVEGRSIGRLNFCEVTNIGLRGYVLCIGIIDFCEETKEDALERNAYLKLKICF
jgi:hypothetical protein